MGLSAYVKFLKKLEKVTHSCIHGAKQKKTIFQKRNPGIINIIKQIMTKHPKLVNADRTKDSADPFIIACAHVRSRSLDSPKVIIVTQEKDRLNKIPFVAKDYNIDCKSLLDFFKNEKWKF